MAQTPYVPYPTVQNSEPAGREISVAGASAQAFGAGVGEAVKGLGASISQAGEVAGKKALEFQGLQNETEKNNLETQAAIEIAAEKTKLSQLNGQAAVDYLPIYNKNVADIQQKYAKLGSSPDVSHGLGMSTTRMAGSAIISGAEAGASAAKFALKSSQEGRIAQAQNDAATQEEQGFKNSLETIRKVSTEFAIREYGADNEAAKVYVSDQIGAAWVKRLELKAMTDPWGAKQMMDKAEIPGKMRLQLQETINRQATQVGARNVANMTAPPLGPGERLTPDNWNLQFYKPQDLMAKTEKGQWVDAGAAVAADKLGKSFFEATGKRVNINAAENAKDPFGTAGFRRGTRDPGDNPGAEYSKHLDGMAFDFQIQGLSDDEKAKFLSMARQAGFGGVGFYEGKSGHLHLDTGPVRQWGNVPEWAKEPMRVMVAKGAEVGLNSDSTAPKKYDALQTDAWIKRARAEAERQFPGQVAVADQAEARVLQAVGRTDRVAKEYQHQQMAAVQSVMYAKQPTTLEELYQGDPNMQRAYAGLSLEDKTKVQEKLKENARGDRYVWNETNLPRYRELIGQYHADPDGFRRQMLIDEKMPGSAIKELIDLQQKRGDPTPQQLSITHARGVLQNLNMLEYYGVPSDGPVNFKFIGALAAYLDRWRAENPRSSAAGPSDAELIKAMPELTRNIGMDKPVGTVSKFFGKRPESQMAFEVDPTGAAASAVEASRSFDRQKVEEGYAPGVVEAVKQVFFEKFRRYPNSGEFDRMYEATTRLKAQFPKKQRPYVPSNQERSR